MDTNSTKRQSFALFTRLPPELKLHILTFMTDTSLLRVIPSVSKHLYELCQSDCLWQGVIELLVRNEAYLWRKGMFMMYPHDGELDSLSPTELVAGANKFLFEPGYLDLYKRVRALFLQFTCPAFSMPAKDKVYFPDPNPPQGQPIMLMNGKPAHILMRTSRDECLLRYVTNGRSGPRGQTFIEDAHFPRFIVFYDIGPQTPACLVRLTHFTMHESSAVAVMEPLCYVKIESLSVEKQPNSKNLVPQTAEFSCLAGQGVSTQLRQANA